MESRHRNKLRELIEEALGTDSVSLDVFPASGRGTVTAFCQEKLKAQAIQIEMKPSVRVPLRRIDASTYSKSGPFSAAPERVTKMIGALESFITYLHQGGDAT